jgi:hypothetical protein
MIKTQHDPHTLDEQNREDFMAVISHMKYALNSHTNTINIILIIINQQLNIEKKVSQAKHIS